MAQNLPFVRQNGITKEQLQQFLGAGAATKVDPDDQAYLDKFAEGYKERLKKAGLSDDRPGAQYGKGRLHPLALLPVWRHGPGARRLGHSQGREEGRGQGRATSRLTLDKVAAMTTDEFIALGKEKIDAFLKENKVPPQFNAEMVIGAMKGGQITPRPWSTA